MRLAEDSRQLTGRVEIDDAYLDGERLGGKAGCGSENKVPFVAAVQTTEARHPRRVRFSKRLFTKQVFGDCLAESTALPLTVVPDGLGGFTGSAEHCADHDRVVTGGGKDSVKHEKFRAANTVLGNLKTAITGTDHPVRFNKYAARYLGEVQYRFNRRCKLEQILGRLVRAAVTTMPQRECFLRISETSRQSGQFIDRRLGVSLSQAVDRVRLLCI